MNDETHTGIDQDHPPLSGLSDLQHENSRALKGSRSSIIRKLRIIFPVIAVCLLCVIFIFSDRKDPIEARPIQEIIPHEMGDNELINPTFEAQDEEKRPFSIISDRAFQEESDSNTVKLEKPVATMRFDDGTRISLQGTKGTYQQEEQSLHLEGNVQFSDEEYQLMTESVDINIDHQSAISHTPVSGYGPIGDVQASGLRADGQNSVFIFTGPATLILNPQQISQTP